MAEFKESLSENGFGVKLLISAQLSEHPHGQIMRIVHSIIRNGILFYFISNSMSSIFQIWFSLLRWKHKHFLTAHFLAEITWSSLRSFLRKVSSQPENLESRDVVSLPFHHVVSAGLTKKMSEMYLYDVSSCLWFVRQIWQSNNAISRVKRGMKALVKIGKGKNLIELQDVTKPEVDTGEVLIGVKFAGICTTDIHIQHDKFPYWPPVIMGHEFSGQIVRIGDNVKNWNIGDRVVAEPHTRACGQCFLCRTGNIQICEHKRSPGWGIDGAFAEFLKMPAHLLHRIPESVSFEEAALAEPTAVVIYEVLERSHVEPGDFVVVVGPGPLGLLSIILSKASGSAKVAVIGTASAEEMRFSLAEEVGTDYLINISEEDPVEAIAELTKGKGADLVVETSGSPSGIACAVEIVRKLGRITSIGFSSENNVLFPWNRAMYKNCQITFTMSSSYSSWDKALALMDGKINVKPLITDVFDIEQWEEAFRLVGERKKGKILFRF